MIFKEEELEQEFASLLRGELEQRFARHLWEVPLSRTFDELFILSAPSCL